MSILIAHQNYEIFSVQVLYFLSGLSLSASYFYDIVVGIFSFLFPMLSVFKDNRFLYTDLIFCDIVKLTYYFQQLFYRFHGIFYINKCAVCKLRQFYLFSPESVFYQFSCITVTLAGTFNTKLMRSGEKGRIHPILLLMETQSEFHQ